LENLKAKIHKLDLGLDSNVKMDLKEIVSVGDGSVAGSLRT
jgi:hypothetical protein